MIHCKKEKNREKNRKCAICKRNFNIAKNVIGIIISCIPFFPTTVARSIYLIYKQVHGPI